MKNRVKVTIAALAVGVLAMCGNMTGYATESADAVSTQAAEFTVTYDGNGGEFVISETTYEKTEVGYNSTVTKFDPPNATRKDYRFDGWYYEVNGEEKKIEPSAKDVQINSFADQNGVTLTAGWTQLVTVTVDGIETGTKVAADNTISVKAPSNTLNLDKWVVNASDANNGWELKPNNNEGMIEVKPAAAEKHVINIDDSTGFGITKDNAKANFVSYWSPQSGKYLVQVKNETGHSLKFSGKTLNDKATSDPEFFGIITELPKKTDNGYFTISDSSIEERVANQNGEYVTYGENNVKVKAYNLTLSASDVERNIKISFESQTGVTYTNESTFVETLKNGATLSPQDLLNTVNNTATRDGFTNYRWTYSVKNSNDKWISADNISSNAWSSDVNADILQKKFDFSFPYYEFEFAPVWQCQINFETRFPETENAPEQPESFYKDEGSTFANFRELEDSKGRYRFNGWKLKGDTRDILYTNNTEYKVTSPSVTFVGQWAAISYPIYWTFGYEDEELREGSFTYGKNIEFLPDPTRTGYTFLGWKMSVGDASTDNGEKISEQLYKAGDKVMMPAGVVTMTAQWKINTYTVTYDGNGTTIGVYKESDSVEYGKNYAIQQVSGITPTRYGYKFLGWRKDNEGDLLKAGGSFTMPAKDVTLVAQWERKSPDLGNKGKHDLSNGVRYTYNGAFRIKGDPSNYQDKITFYVPKAGEYTFE